MMKFDDELPFVTARRSTPPPPPRYRMEPSTRIALAIVGSVLGAIAYREFDHWRRVQAVNEALQNIADVAQQSLAQSQAEMQREQQALAARATYRLQQAAIERARYVLADNQRCVGGAVVQVDGNSYTQVGSISQPVHCTGQVADRPLR